MPKCKITGKKPLVGYKVSHAHNKSKKRQQPNVQSKRFWDETEGKFVKLKVSARGIRTIQKKGLQAALKDVKA
jgi:large subunit ribosomal protein L28